MPSCSVDVQAMSAENNDTAMNSKVDLYSQSQLISTEKLHCCRHSRNKGALCPACCKDAIHHSLAKM